MLEITLYLWIAGQGAPIPHRGFTDIPECREAGREWVREIKTSEGATFSAGFSCASLPPASTTGGGTMVIAPYASFNGPANEASTIISGGQ